MLYTIFNRQSTQDIDVLSPTKNSWACNNGAIGNIRANCVKEEFNQILERAEENRRKILFNIFSAN